MDAKLVYPGYQLNEMGIRNVDKVNSPTYSRKIKNVITEHALFSELNYKISGKFNGRFGLRGNYIEEFSKTLVEPRLQFNYSVLPNLNIELQAEAKHQIYSQIIDLQQDFLGIEKRRWIVANDKDIPILKSKQIALGSSYKKNNWLFTIDNFYKKIEGITTQSQGFQNQFEFVKTSGNYSIFGSEILLQKQWQKWLAWISYSVMKNDYDFDTLNPNQFPNNYEISHHLKSALITEISNLKLSIGSIWFTGKPNTLLVSNTPVYNLPQIPEIAYQNPNEANLKNYLQVNFSSSYEVRTSSKSKLNFGFSILNLFNRKSFINQHYRIDNITQNIEEVNTYSLERTFNGFVRFSLLP